MYSTQSSLQSNRCTSGNPLISMDIIMIVLQCVGYFSSLRLGADQTRLSIVNLTLWKVA